MHKWEFLFITTDLEKSIWRPRFVNGIELPDWKKGLPIPEYANQLGEQGWELIVSTIVEAGSPYTYRYVFKRLKD
jgi:hypothetical protein